MDDDSGDSEEDEGEDWFRQADVVKQEVCSRDEAMHVGKNGFWFLTRSWLEGEQQSQQRKYEYSEEVGERLDYAGRAEWLWEPCM